MPDRDVFIISVVRHAIPAEAIRQAVVKAELNPRHVQDAIFGAEAPHLSDADEILRAAGLDCPTVSVSSGLRAVMFAAQAILSGDMDLVVAVGLDGEDSAALLVASPEAVGRLNLTPRARLAARSLSGGESALRATGLTAQDLAISLNGKAGALLVEELLRKLEEQKTQWGLVSVGSLALLVERI